MSKPKSYGDTEPLSQVWSQGILQSVLHDRPKVAESCIWKIWTPPAWQADVCDLGVRSWALVVAAPGVWGEEKPGNDAAASGCWPGDAAVFSPSSALGLVFCVYPQAGPWLTLDPQLVGSKVWLLSGSQDNITKIKTQLESSMIRNLPVRSWGTMHISDCRMPLDIISHDMKSIYIKYILK